MPCDLYLPKVVSKMHKIHLKPIFNRKNIILDVYNVFVPGPVPSVVHGPVLGVVSGPFELDSKSQREQCLQ